MNRPTVYQFPLHPSSFCCSARIQWRGLYEGEKKGSQAKNRPQICDLVSRSSSRGEGRRGGKKEKGGATRDPPSLPTVGICAQKRKGKEGEKGRRTVTNIVGTVAGPEHSACCAPWLIA